VESAAIMDTVMEHMSKLGSNRPSRTAVNREAALAAMEGRGFETVGGHRIKTSR